MIQNPAIQGGGGEPEMVTVTINVGRATVYTYDGKTYSSGSFRIPKNTVIFVNRVGGVVIRNNARKLSGLPEYMLYLVTGDCTLTVN